MHNRTIPDDLSRWHWLTSPANVFRLTNGDYTTRAHGRLGQACDEARAWLRRADERRLQQEVMAFAA